MRILHWFTGRVMRIHGKFNPQKQTVSYLGEAKLRVSGAANR